MAQRIPSAQLAAGQILAEPICDPQGRVLSGAGSRLTPALIHRLQKWGVASVLIEDEGGTSSDAQREAAADAQTKQDRIPDFLDEQYMRQVAVEINTRFRLVKDQPVMEMIKKIAFKKIVMLGPRAIPGRA